jgi:hypothetical protein
MCLYFPVNSIAITIHKTSYYGVYPEHISILNLSRLEESLSLIPSKRISLLNLERRDKRNTCQYEHSVILRVWLRGLRRRRRCAMSEMINRKDRRGTANILATTHRASAGDRRVYIQGITHVHGSETL